MAVTGAWYGAAFVAAFNKEIDLNSDVVRVMLVTGYTPNQDTHNYLDDVRSTEVTGTGYTADGVQLTGVSVTYTGASNVFAFDANDASWATSTISATHAIVYVDTGSDATSPLICYIAFGETKSSSAGTFTVQFGAGGVVTVTVGAEA